MKGNLKPSKICSELCPACRRRYMSPGSSACRRCFLAGRGRKKPGRHGRSIFEVLAQVKSMDLKVGQSVVIDGLQFTRTKEGFSS